MSALETDADLVPISLGAFVRWRSHAAGKSAVKYGTIVYLGRCGEHWEVGRRPAVEWVDAATQADFNDACRNTRSRIRADTCRSGVVVSVHRIDVLDAGHVARTRFHHKGLYYCPTRRRLRVCDPLDLPSPKTDLHE